MKAAVMMNRRKIVLLSAIGAAVAISRAGAADASARAFIAAIYNAYKGKSGNGISLDSDATIGRYFEPGLAALIIKDRKDAADRGEAPTLSGDPFVDSGDWDLQACDIAVQDVAPSKASGAVKLQNFDKPKTVVLDLVKLKEGWRIADIAWQRDGETESLRGLFTQQ
jgi:hypothetical protein